MGDSLSVGKGGCLERRENNFRVLGNSMSRKEVGRKTGSGGVQDGCVVVTKREADCVLIAFVCKKNGVPWLSGQRIRLLKIFV